jgi:hypothetical protein
MQKTWAILAVLTGFLISCSNIVYVPEPTVVNNGGFISGSPCSAPCFSGVIPGETNFDQVKSLLNKNGYDHGCETYVGFDNRKLIECKNPYVWIGATAKTNLVDDIYMSLINPVGIDEVIKKYGQPDSIAVRFTSLPDYADMAATLFFNSFQMTITLETSIEVTYPVSTSSRVVEVEYFDIDSYKKRQDFYHPSEWKGFGSYKLTQY